MSIEQLQSLAMYRKLVERAATWKLPYLNADGSVDEKRLPEAIRVCSRIIVGRQ